MSIVNNIPLEQDIIVDLTESQIEVAYANQYDDSSRQINCHIQNNGVDFPCENYTVSLWLRKTNDCGFTRTIGVDGFGSVSNNVVSFPILKEMTYSHGRQVCNLELLQGDSVVYSCVFYLRVNKVGVQQEDILDSDDYKSVHDEFHLLEEKINELGDLSDLRSEIYTDSSTTPTNQEDGDYWTRLLDENGKAERYVKQGNEYKLLSYATSSESVEMTDGTDLQTKINNLEEDISSLDATPDNIVLYADDGEVTEIPDVDNNGTSSNYELPVATADTLGGVKQGENVAIAEDGTISVEKVVVDSELSEFSTNPVQNKVIVDTISDLQSSISTNSKTIGELSKDLNKITWKEVTSEAHETFDISDIAENITELLVVAWCTTGYDNSFEPMRQLITSVNIIIPYGYLGLNYNDIAAYGYGGHNNDLFIDSSLAVEVEVTSTQVRISKALWATSDVTDQVSFAIYYR